MVRIEISLFLKNVPGESGKLASMLEKEGINSSFAPFNLAKGLDGKG
ncbi:MAG: hypothetical protein JRD93_01955 [Deltaproteobacteria bacterium]|nr:hypothetical protein [Deltaproteobacteria bacterium]MBW2660761.1 hypothetical protein [Deltaproteobacteria bacterium]